MYTPRSRESSGKQSAEVVVRAGRKVMLKPVHQFPLYDAAVRAPCRLLQISPETLIILLSRHYGGNDLSQPRLPTS